ncbi:hypothetical protein DL93DRAFT_2093600 [Clavulina sp. PMI_390]|nr:hypothetical protein DL93DRAFT_2093600 [Clavulina sp. PMI_390]
MSVRLEIIPLARSLDMFGTPHTSTAYSLSGNILITISPPSPSSFLTFTPSHPPSVRLKSLSIVFEGKTECLSPVLGYHPLRLCRVEKLLIGLARPPDPSEAALCPHCPSNPASEPDASVCSPRENSTATPTRGEEAASVPSPAPVPEMTLSCTGGPPDDGPWQWSVLFDMAIPGWLPATMTTEQNVETSYSLHACATYEILEPPRLESSPSHTQQQQSHQRTSSWASRWFPSWLPLWPFSSRPLRPSAESKRQPKGREARAEPVVITLNRLALPNCPPPPTMASAAPHPLPSLLPSPYPEPPQPSVHQLPFFQTVHQDVVPFVLLHEVDERNGIPVELLKAVDIVVSLPEKIDIDSGSIPFGLRVRGVPQRLRQRSLRMVKFEVQVYQVDIACPQPDPIYLALFPLPPVSHQPPHLPLLHPSPIHRLVESRLFPISSQCPSSSRHPPSTSLSSSHAGGKDATKRFPLLANGVLYFHPTGVYTGGIVLDDRWTRIDVDVPVLRPENPAAPRTESLVGGGGNHRVCVDRKKKRERAERRRKMMPSGMGPLGGVKHEMQLMLHMEWEPEAGWGERGVEVRSRVRTSVVRCVIDLDFVRIPSELRVRRSNAGSRPSLSPSAAGSSPNLLGTRTPSSHASNSSLSSLFSLTPSASSSISAPSSSLSSLPVTPPPSAGFLVNGANTDQAPNPVLPAYMQLFHENGERREDDVGPYGCWLPPYVSNTS